jgi:hypothetical protein
MSTLSLRLPDSLHRALRELARKEGISINQFVASAVGEKLAALMTEEYLDARAARGRRDLYDRALGKAMDAEPAPGDRISDAPRASVSRKKARSPIPSKRAASRGRKPR